MYTDLNEELFKGSFYQYARDQLHWNILNCTQNIEARGLSKRAAELLQLQEGEPALYSSSVTHLVNGRAIIYTRSFFNAEHINFTHHFTR
jgi:DNA-binding GntR family transcriptional regulator